MAKQGAQAQMNAALIAVGAVAPDVTIVAVELPVMIVAVEPVVTVLLLLELGFVCTVKFQNRKFDK
jgi:hypothetical protein